MSYHLFSKKWVAARKPHACIWCCERIVPMEVYLREASIYDGNHQNFAWHWDCWFDARVNYFNLGEVEFTPGMERPEMRPFRCMEAANLPTAVAETNVNAPDDAGLVSGATLNPTTNI